MKKLSPSASGMALGTLFALWHLGWGVLVAMGLAQALLNFVYWLHFLNNPFLVGVFDPTRTLLLVVVTFIIGYVLGWLFGFLWNSFHRK